MADPAAPVGLDLDVFAITRRFHEAYERIAPEYGYVTRPESAVAWQDVPEPNKTIMLRAVKEAIDPLLDLVSRQARVVEAAQVFEWACGRAARQYDPGTIEHDSAHALQDALTGLDTPPVRSLLPREPK